MRLPWSPRHRRVRTRAIVASRVAVALTLAAVTAASGVWIAPAAHADSSNDLRAKAASLANQIDRLGRDLEKMVEAYNQAADASAGLDKDLAASTAQVQQMESDLGGLQAGVRDFAVKMFASGNQSGGVGELLGGSAHLTDTIVKDQLGSLALTNGQQLTNDLASKLGDLHTARDRLARQKEAKSKLLATLQSRQAAAEQKQKQLLALQNTTNAALKQALADEQIRREAAAARSRAEAVKARRTKRAGGGQSSSGAASDAGGGGNSGSAAGSNDNSNDNSGSSSGGSAGGGSAGGGASGGSPGGGSSGGGSGNGRPGHRVPPPSPGASGAVAAALSQVGVPYISFMSQPGVGFDCSGLTMWAWARAGVGLPHYSKAQYELTQHVDPSDAQPGDLLFFYHPISHVGMYIGGGRMIDASHPGKPISVHGFGWSQVVGVGRPG